MVISESEKSPLNLALGSHKEGWAVLSNESGCCVDQRKPVCYCVLCQTILFCQESAKHKREYAKQGDKGGEKGEKE